MLGTFPGWRAMCLAPQSSLVVHKYICGTLYYYAFGGVGMSDKRLFDGYLNAFARSTATVVDTSAFGLYYCPVWYVVYMRVVFVAACGLSMCDLWARACVSACKNICTVTLVRHLLWSMRRTCAQVYASLIDFGWRGGGGTGARVSAYRWYVGFSSRFARVPINIVMGIMCNKPYLLESCARAEQLLCRTLGGAIQWGFLLLFCG